MTPITVVGASPERARGRESTAGPVPGCALLTNGRPDPSTWQTEERS